MSIISKLLEARKRLGKIEPAKMEYKNVKYDYIAEEEVTTKVREIFNDLGIVIYPYEVTTSYPSNNLTEVIINYYVVDAEDETSIEVSGVGQGYDNADKGSAKAMTGAYKYAMRQLLMIPSPERDPDKQSSEELKGTTAPQPSYPKPRIVKPTDDVDPASVIIPFGKKYKGETMGDVLAKDKSYIEWLAGHEGDLQTLAQKLLEVSGG